MRRCPPARTQLSLDLDRVTSPPPSAAPVSAEVVPVLADLLLAALGHGAAARLTEGGDERQDHR
jgi:hypothetical protein